MRGALILAFAAALPLFVLADVPIQGDRPPDPMGVFAVSGWSMGDLTSLNNAIEKGAVDEVDLDWFSSKRSGEVAVLADHPEFIAAARAGGLKVLATVSNLSPTTWEFDPRVAKAILASSSKRQRHVAALVGLCESQGYDGIDLDWESLRVKDRDRFSSFVEELAQALHAQGKVLGIAVHPKSSEPGGWSGARAQDWARIGAAVDEFKVMTYDYSGSWSAPGPIAPPDWMDAVVAHAESLVPAPKIMMGLPFYGYDWHGGKASGLDWADAQALIEQYQPALERDPSGEVTFGYEDLRGARHTVFFQDEASIRAKLGMMVQKHAGIHGIAIWVLNREDPRFWDAIDSLLRH